MVGPMALDGRKEDKCKRDPRSKEPSEGRNDREREKPRTDRPAPTKTDQGREDRAARPGPRVNQEASQIKRGVKARGNTHRRRKDRRQDEEGQARRRKGHKKTQE